MPSELVSLSQLFPAARRRAPATEAEVAAVESSLGVKLPPQLRRFFFESNGFREDKGSAAYLFSLTEEDDIGSLLSRTRYWWEEWPEYYPNLDFRPFVFFGSSSADECWGIDWKSGGRIIAYHHHMEDQYEEVGTSISEVWRADYAKYESLEK